MSDVTDTCNKWQLSADFMNGVSEGFHRREVELKQAITRVASGDVLEAIRAVVQRVTDDMELSIWPIANQVPEDWRDRASDLMYEAKLRAFKECTGAEFESEDLRKYRLEQEMKEARNAN